MDINFVDEIYTKPSPISESITNFLRNFILSGKLKPGEKINEREIAQSLQVSRSPIREAIRLIAKEGLVTILPRKGAIVSELSKRELLEIFENREMIEIFAIDLIKKHSIRKFEEISKSIVEIRSDMNNILEYLNQVTKFHMALVKTAGNMMLYQFYNILCNSLKRYQLRIATIPKRLELSMEEHKDILEAMEKEEFENAKDLLRRHIQALRLKIINEIDISD